MQTAPTSPSGRTVNEGSTTKIRNTKEIEYKSFIKKEDKKARKKSISSKRPDSGQNQKAKISIKNKVSNSMLAHKRTSSNSSQTFYVTPAAKQEAKNMILSKVMNETFTRGNRNTSNLAPSKTQHEKYKAFGSGTGVGPVKIGLAPSNTGDGSWRGVAMFVPDKTSDAQTNRTYDTRRSSKTNRKKIKIVSSIKPEIRTNTKFVNYK